MNRKRDVEADATQSGNEAKMRERSRFLDDDKVHIAMPNCLFDSF
jgi:hypothetical protein